MQFKAFIFTVFATIMIAEVTGCAIFTPERVAAIHRTAATTLRLA